MKLSTMFALFIGVGVGVLIIVGFFIYPVKAMTVPAVFGIPASLLSIAQASREYFEPKKQKAESEIRVIEHAKGMRQWIGLWRTHLIAGAWIVGAIAAVFVFGFLIALPLFIVAYLKIHGEGWILSIVLALVMLAIAHFGSIGLRIPLYGGLFS